MNYNIQYYRGLPLRLINRNYKPYKAMRFLINETNQNIWIPKKHLHEDGTIKQDEDIMYIFLKAQRQLELAGYTLGFAPAVSRGSSEFIEENEK